jgi:hypothetical protein
MTVVVQGLRVLIPLERPLIPLTRERFRPMGTDAFSIDDDNRRGIPFQLTQEDAQKILESIEKEDSSMTTVKFRVRKNLLRKSIYEKFPELDDRF